MHRSSQLQCFLTILSVAAALIVPAATAHHSPVAFNTEVTDFTVTGVIDSVDVRNPHSVMKLNVDNEDGTETVWDIEFSSINLLSRRGWDFDRLEAGELAGELVVSTGNPSASGKNEMYMWSIIMSDGTEFGQ